MRWSPGRSLSGDKAQRIIDAMRRSVAKRGSAGSTFDQVSREAGVSRGLLHYYFGTKEQLLVEAVRRDCELRLERLEGQLSTARTADDFINLMAQSLYDTIQEEPDFVTLVFELFTLSRRNADIAARVRGAHAPLARARGGHARGCGAGGRGTTARRARGRRRGSLLARGWARPADAQRARARLRADDPGGHRLRAGIC